MKKVHFSVVIMLCDMEMRAISTSMNYSGQSHLMTLAKGHFPVICHHFQRTFHFKLLGQFQVNFICSLKAKGVGGGGEESLYKIVLIM